MTSERCPVGGRAGFPRPRSPEGLPVPYVSAGVDDLGTLDPVRVQDTIDRFACVVCGLPVTGDTCVVAVGDVDGQWVIVDDHGLTHDRCARMAQRLCPALREHQLRFVRVDAHRLRTTLPRVVGANPQPVPLGEVADGFTPFPASDGHPDVAAALETVSPQESVTRPRWSW